MELTTASITALLTLTAMETVLGIDNIIFIAILVGKLPAHQQNKIRNLGIGLALVIPFDQISIDYSRLQP